jgi:sigma-B regulation protein RsbU (phosphoserine phosphatase)
MPFQPHDATEPHLILVVEDEPISREILLENLGDAGYQTLAAADGDAAWTTIQSHGDRLIAIVLDRMLPGMDGMEVLRRLKADPALSHLPVIMQTAMAAHEDIMEGLQAGAHYYLTKPVNPDTLLAIVDSAVADYSLYLSLRGELRQTTHTLRLLDRAEFLYRTTSEARDIATLLANAAPDPQRVVLGLTELMLNAVEHGNLGITYDEKSALIVQDQLEEEIRRRQGIPPYQERQVRVRCSREGGKLNYVIQDQGAGFDYARYLELDPARAFDSHGRGIALAAKMSFDGLEYRGCGNTVAAWVKSDR